MPHDVASAPVTSVSAARPDCSTSGGGRLRAAADQVQAVHGQLVGLPEDDAEQGQRPTTETVGAVSSSTGSSARYRAVASRLRRSASSTSSREAAAWAAVTRALTASGSGWVPVAPVRAEATRSAIAVWSSQQPRCTQISCARHPGRREGRSRSTRSACGDEGVPGGEHPRADLVAPGVGHPLVSSHARRVPGARPGRRDMPAHAVPQPVLTRGGEEPSRARSPDRRSQRCDQRQFRGTAASAAHRRAPATRVRPPAPRGAPRRAVPAAGRGRRPRRVLGAPRALRGAAQRDQRLRRRWATPSSPRPRGGTTRCCWASRRWSSWPARCCCSCRCRP